MWDTSRAQEYRINGTTWRALQACTVFRLVVVVFFSSLLSVANVALRRQNAYATDSRFARLVPNKPNVMYDLHVRFIPSSRKRGMICAHNKHGFALRRLLFFFSSMSFLKKRTGSYTPASRSGYLEGARARVSRSTVDTR